MFTFDYRVGIRVHFWLQVGTVCNFDYQLDQMSANGFHEELKLILNTYIIKTRSIHIYNCVIARHHGLQFPRAVMHKIAHAPQHVKNQTGLPDIWPVTQPFSEKANGCGMTKSTSVRMVRLRMCIRSQYLDLSLNILNQIEIDNQQ